MKKSLSLFLALVMVLALAVPVLATAPASTNANRNPGTYVVTEDDITVRIGGNGNSARLIAYVDGVEYRVFARPANNRYNIISVEGFELGVFVRGNSILHVTVKSAPTPPACIPYVVETYSFYSFVRLNQVESYFVGTGEVAGSREFVGGSAVKYNWVRSNEIEGVNGMGVISGARVTGTLNYQFVRNYVEQFERVYEWVDVTVWSDGTRDEVEREDSEHVRGGLVDGYAYYTGPYAGSRAIDVTSGQVVLHMGHGQSDAYGRFTTIAGGFSLALELHNTGSTPDITVTITDVDLAAL